MEAEKTLTNEEIIRELLDLLKKNTMKEQANDVFEICTYVDGLEKKIVSMTEELTSMQDQIKKMQEDIAPLLYRCPLILPNKKPEVSGRDLDTWKRSRSLPFWKGDFLIPQKSRTERSPENRLCR